MEIKKVLVTPELAKEMLSKNLSKNRKLRGYSVRGFAEDMRTGRWNEEVVQPISFSDQGDLLDGQHRLRAVIESGKSVLFYVVYGVSEDTFEFYDIGAKRSTADVYGGKYATTKTSIGAPIYAIENSDQKIQSVVQNTIGRRVKVTHKQILEATKKYDLVLTDIARKTNYVKESTRKGSMKGVGLLMWIHYKLNDSKFDEYINSFYGKNRSIAALETANKILKHTKDAHNCDMLTTMIILEKGYRVFLGEASTFKQKSSTIEKLLNDYISQIRRDYQLEMDIYEEK